MSHGTRPHPRQRFPEAQGRRWVEVGVFRKGDRESHGSFGQTLSCPLAGNVLCSNRSRQMTFASKITITRILMVPVFAVLAVLYGQSVAKGAADESLRWWALGVFITASASDGLDGWVARRFNQRSKFGATIDPIADKLLLLTGIVVLSLVDWGPDGWRIPLWFMGLVILRDTIILGGFVVLYLSRCDMSVLPRWSGKLCTVTQMFVLGWVMLKVVHISPIYPCLLATIFTVWSGVEYLCDGIGRLKSGPKTAQ